MLVKLDHPPGDRGKNEKYLTPQTVFCWLVDVKRVRKGQGQMMDDDDGGDDDDDHHHNNNNNNNNRTNNLSHLFEGTTKTWTMFLKTQQL